MSGDTSKIGGSVTVSAPMSKISSPPSAEEAIPSLLFSQEHSIADPLPPFAMSEFVGCCCCTCFPSAPPSTPTSVSTNAAEHLCFPVAIYFAIQLIWGPILYTFVFGGYDGYLPELLFNVACLRLLFRMSDQLKQTAATKTRLAPAQSLVSAPGLMCSSGTVGWPLRWAEWSESRWKSPSNYIPASTRLCSWARTTRHRNCAPEFPPTCPTTSSTCIVAASNLILRPPGCWDA